MVFRVLYVFSGIRRKANLKYWLGLGGKTASMDIVVEEVDVLHGSEHDLLNEDVWRKLRGRIKAGEFDAIVISPPCSTYSRSRLNKRGGPPPLRSRKYPWGFPWLAGKRRDKIENANALIRITLEVLSIAGDLHIPFVLEFPEDLGMK